MIETHGQAFPVRGISPPDKCRHTRTHSVSISFITSVPGPQLHPAQELHTAAPPIGIVSFGDREVGHQFVSLVIRLQVLLLTPQQCWRRAAAPVVAARLADATTAAAVRHAEHCI
jgi:hypothetical protein